MRRPNPLALAAGDGPVRHARVDSIFEEAAFEMKSFYRNRVWISLVAGLVLLPVSQVSLAESAIRIDDRVESRWERREDAVENSVDGVQDRHEFREERRDCVGDGSDCRQDNRDDRDQDSVDRAQDRQDDRAGRVNKRFD
jgi:hypothetical protein